MTSSGVMEGAGGEWFEDAEIEREGQLSMMCWNWVTCGGQLIPVLLYADDAARNIC